MQFGYALRVQGTIDGVKREFTVGIGTGNKPYSREKDSWLTNPISAAPAERHRPHALRTGERIVAIFGSQAVPLDAPSAESKAGGSWGQPIRSAILTAYEKSL
jgi:hypothetical protein